jgi:hypothetical protein
MADNQTVFTDEAEFNAAALPVNFDPVIAADVTPLMEKNQKTAWDNFTRAQAQGDKNIAFQNEWEKYSQNRNVAQLEKFSDRLVSLANTGAKKIIEKQEAEGEALAHTQGAAHIAAIEPNVPGDTERAIEGQALANDLGASAENDGASTEIVQNFENLGAYAKVAYTNQLLQTAGNNYSQWRQGEEAQNITVPVPDGQGGMKHVNLQSAGSSAEIAAITTEVKKQYLQKYKGLGTLTGRNKYLWQKMDEHETAIANARGEEMRQSHDKQRKQEINDQFIVALQNGPEAAKEKLEELVKLHGGRYTPQGLIDNVFVGIGKALDSDQITGEEVDALLDMMIKDKSAGGKEIKLRDSVVYRKALSNNGISNKIEDQKNRVVNKHNNLIERETFKLKQTTLESIRQFENDKGRAITEDELKQFINQWNSVKKKDGNIGEVPEEITKYLTAEDQAEDDAQATADYYIRELGYLPQDIADTLPWAVRNADEYKSKTKTRRFAHASTENLNAAKIRARTGANTYYNTNIGPNQAVPRDIQDFETRGLESYQRNYAKNKLNGMSDADAHTEAMKQLDTDSDKGVFVKPLEASEGHRSVENYILGSKHLRANNNDFTNKIPGLDTNGDESKGTLSTIQQLDKIASGESFKLPPMFRSIGADYKPVNGVPAEWALAAAQYKAYTGKDLPLPNHMNTTGQLQPYLESMLSSKPSMARTNRVIVTTHPKGESKGEEEEDNSSTNDTTKSETKEKKPEVEGDVNKDGVVNQEDLLELIGNRDSVQNGTTGDSIYAVLLGMDNGHFSDNVGLYNVNRETIKAALKELKLDVNQPFDSSTQGKIFLYSIRERCKANNSLAGLRERFPSLSTVNQATFDKYTRNVQPNNPYNDANSGCVDVNVIKAKGK